jgi:hypothetical protein
MTVQPDESQINPSDAEANDRKPASKQGTHNAAPSALCWPFPAGSQNNTDKAVKLKPYVPAKRRTLNQY